MPPKSASRRASIERGSTSLRQAVVRCCDRPRRRTRLPGWPSRGWRERARRLARGTHPARARDGGVPLNVVPQGGVLRSCKVSKGNKAPQARERTRVEQPHIPCIARELT
eukprot:4186448-Pleurochrysis_carterae.AAC.1